MLLKFWVVDIRQDPRVIDNISTKMEFNLELNKLSSKYLKALYLNIFLLFKNLPLNLRGYNNELLFVHKNCCKRIILSNWIILQLENP